MKTLKKLKLKELSNLKLLTKVEAESLKGGIYNSSYDYFAGSYGIPDGGAAYSYTVSGGISYDENGTIFISAMATENGTDYSGQVKLYLNGQLVSTQNFTDPELPSYLQEGTTLIGNTTFDISSYSDITDIKVEISTQQSKETGSGTAYNVISNSYTVDIF